MKDHPESKHTLNLMSESLKAVSIFDKSVNYTDRKKGGYGIFLVRIMGS